MTTDPSDRATEQEELARAAAIANCRKPEGPAATGYCLYCYEEIAGGRRWCGPEHRDLWQKQLLPTSF